MNDVINQFVESIRCAGIDIPRAQIEVHERGCPHAPTELPVGKMGVYCFRDGERWLKIGKVGIKSRARFQWHHYSPSSSQSNLAKSLITDPKSPCFGFSAPATRDWMLNSLSRTDVLIDARFGMNVLSLIESYLICRLSPQYEGFERQKA